MGLGDGYVSFEAGTGGGTGTITGSVAPTQVAYGSAVANVLTSDALFTRNPATNDTVIAKDFGSNEQGGINIGILGQGLSVGYENTSTGESAAFFAGRDSLIHASILYTDGVSIEGGVTLDSNGNSMVWDADTTDNIITGLQQSQDILNLGLFSGSAIYHSDTSSNLISVVGIGDFTPSVGSVSSATLITTNTVTNDTAAVRTFYDVGDGHGASLSANNGTINATVECINSQAQIYYEDLVTNEIVNFIATAGNAVMRYSPDGVVQTEIIVGDQVVTITNVQSYADDTAATGAGLATGQLYKTTTVGSTFLKIVP